MSQIESGLSDPSAESCFDVKTFLASSGLPISPYMLVWSRLRPILCCLFACIWAWGRIAKKLDYITMVGNNTSTLGVSAAQLDNGFNTVSTSLSAAYMSVGLNPVIIGSNRACSPFVRER